MWYKVSTFILKNRHYLLAALVLSTALMASTIRYEVDYGFSKVIPEENQIFQEFQTFKNLFGEDSGVMVVGVESGNMFKKDYFNDWYNLGEQIKSVDGVQQVLSVAHCYDLIKNKEAKLFEAKQLVPHQFETQAEIDSIRDRLYNLPFYEGFLYNKETGAYLMIVALDDEDVYSSKRLEIVAKIQERGQAFGMAHQSEMIYAGLPFIKSYKITAVSKEVRLFLLYSGLMAFLILLVLFRSFYAVVFSMIVVAVGVVWALGLISLFDYKINLLTGLIPTLLVVIGVPNSVYLLNKYHSEFRKHGNKIKALSRMIEKIGYVTFFANLTTAIGFVVFSFTDALMLREFGIVAGLVITAMFVISLVSIPVVFSFLPEPKMRHTSHLEGKLFTSALEKMSHLSQHHRRKIYLTAFVLGIIAVGGMIQLTPRGHMLDDVPHESKIYQDLMFVERNFNGIMPFEIVIDTKKKGGATQISTLKKIDRAQKLLDEDSVISKSISVVDGLKFGTQAFFNGNPKHYRLPKDGVLTNEVGMIMKYFGSAGDEGQEVLKEFIDSTKQYARISSRMLDIGSDKLPELIAELKPQFDEIFDTARYNLAYTGTSVVAFEGFRYVIYGLINSVALAFVLISLIMAYLFVSARMLLLSLIPNIVPLVFTAALMGYAGIPLKPSTVLIFSIAFGISVDFTIHFLAKYKQELPRVGYNISEAVNASLTETGRSMIYTAIILFFGFITFTASSFEGTFYLGLLTSITLVVALFSNLILLPSLLLTFDKIVNKEGKYFTKKLEKAERKKKRKMTAKDF